MPLDVAEALRVGRFAQLAYAPSGTPITYAIPQPGFEVVDVIYGNDLATDINALQAFVPFGFIAQSAAPASEVVVAIRGTEGIWEWIQDARFLRIPCPFASGAGETEDGFTAVYMSLRTGGTAGPRLVDALATLLKTKPATKLTVTGHSLGAALATLFALDVTEKGVFASPAVTTFASPFVGDAQFARTYDAEVPDTWRIANAVDLVPKAPPPFWGFDHVNQLAAISSLGKAKLFPVCTHAMSTYMYLLDQSAGGSTFKLDATCVGLL